MVMKGSVSPRPTVSSREDNSKTLMESCLPEKRVVKETILSIVFTDD